MERELEEEEREHKLDVEEKHAELVAAQTGLLVSFTDAHVELEKLRDQYAKLLVSTKQAPQAPKPEKVVNNVLCLTVIIDLHIGPYFWQTNSLPPTSQSTTNHNTASAIECDFVTTTGAGL